MRVLLPLLVFAVAAAGLAWFYLHYRAAKRRLDRADERERQQLREQEDEWLDRQLRNRDKDTE